MTILEGLAHVRKRPGMYIGGTGVSGLHHLVWEVVDNSVDEAMAGFCDRIDVTILADGGCRVIDNGRGIPTDVHPEFKLTGVEIALTKLGGGGKFGGDGYKVSGGLHGVGVSVVNALSEKVVVEVDRGGKRHRIEFAEGGAKKTKLEVVGDSPRGRTGTTVSFWPDRGLFETTEFVARTMLERFQMMAFLNKGLEIRFKDEREGHDNEPVVFKYAGGIIDFVKHVNSTKTPLFSRVGYLEATDEEAEVEIAFQWNEGYQADGLHSFANGIATIGGGTHEEGFRAALTTVVNKYAKAKGLLKEKDPNLGGEDVREGLTGIISVRLREPQFEGQTKDKLGNPEIKTLVQKATNESWPTGSRSTRPRPTRSSRRASTPSGLGPRPATPVTPLVARVPSTVPACPTSCGTARAGIAANASCSSWRATLLAGRPPAPVTREPRRSLPIRGKILNVERARLDKMLKNTEVQALISAIGAGFGAEEFDVTKSRYDRVILLCDADVDGSHIRTLLLTFFFRHMKDLVEHRHVYIAQPPLYSTVVGKEKIYLKDDAAKAAFLRQPQPSQGVRPTEGPRRDGLGRAQEHHHGLVFAHPPPGHRRTGGHR
jgi:DNA gyrase subunit B